MALVTCLNDAIFCRTAGKAFLPESWREKKVAAIPFLEKPWISASSYQLFVGGTDSGAAMHFHGAAYNVIFFGYVNLVFDGLLASTLQHF